MTCHHFTNILDNKLRTAVRLMEKSEGLTRDDRNVIFYPQKPLMSTDLQSL